MSAENVEIVRRVYDAVRRHDPGSVIEFYDPQVEWDMSGHPFGDLITGTTVYHGHVGLRAWFRQWYEAWESTEELHRELIDTGDHVVSVVTVRTRGRASGIEVDMPYAAVWTLSDGKVVSVSAFATREALEAAGLEV